MKQLKISKWVMVTVVALVMENDSAWAQRAPEPVPVPIGQTPPPQRFFPSPASGVVEPTFDLSFPGGTIVEFVETVSAARGRPVNILIDEADRSVRIPPVAMTGVTVGTLLQALNLLGRTRDQPFEFATGNFSTPGEPVWSLVTVPAKKLGAEQVKFFNLEPYLTKNTVEDITTALNAGYQLKTGSNERLNLKFHKETQLLMVRGGPEELVMVADVLSQLKPSAQAKSPAVQSKPGEAAPKSSGQ